MSLTRIALATAALTAALAPAAGAAQFKCNKAGSTTITSNKQARVFAVNGLAKVCDKNTNVRFTLAGASPTEDVFTLGGKFVGYSSGAEEAPEHSVVNVVHIPTRKIPKYMPTRTNAHVDAIVVKRNGASAWAYSDDEYTTVQGHDRAGHSPDNLDDDTKTVVTTSLRGTAGAGIQWTYTDGSVGTADLFTEPAEIF